MAGKKGMKQLKWEDRIRLESFLTAGITSNAELGRRLNVCRQTIYKERKRGTGDHIDTELRKSRVYYADLGEAAYKRGQNRKGKPLKIGNDYAFADFIEEQICDEKRSPAAALAKAAGQFKTRICVSTLYSYISGGVFFRLDDSFLPVKGKRKSKKKPERIQKRAQAGDSIDKRPKEVETREEFGHWEGDTVVGCRGGGKEVILTMTERKTRYQIIELMPDKSAASAVTAMDEIERRFGRELFAAAFKTVTFDNGTEFADASGLSASCLGDGARTALYYAHPYSSYERGSSENGNRMIRRLAPKGTDFSQLSGDDIKAIEAWCDDYPRRILGYKTSGEVFAEEIARLAIPPPQD